MTAGFSSCNRNQMWGALITSHHTAAQCTVNPTNAVKTPQHLSTKPVSILQHFILLPLHTHCVKTKRKKVNFESHASKVQWSVGFFCYWIRWQALYLLCSDTIALLKECSWHYQISTHYTNSVITMIRKLRKSHHSRISSQKSQNKNKAAVKVSFWVAYS